MTVVPVKVKKRIITCKKPLVAGNVETYTMDFTFDELWSEFTKRVIFQNDSLAEDPIGVDLEGSTLVVPWEVLKEPGNLYLTVKGTKSTGPEVVLTQEMDAPIKVYEHGISNGEDPLAPTPDSIDVITKTAAQALEYASSVKEAADSGEFDGKDYVLTDADKQEIAEMVSGGSSGGTGTTDYEKLENKPTINGVELIGDVEIDIPKKTSELTNDSDFTTKDYVDDLVSKSAVSFTPLAIDSNLDISTLTTGAYQITNSGNAVAGEYIYPVEAGSLIYFVSLGGYGDYNCVIVSHLDVIGIQYVEREYKISCLSDTYNVMAFLIEFTENTLPETYATKEYVDEKFNSIVNGNEVAY